jgi:hypothetical protein
MDGLPKQALLYNTNQGEEEMWAVLGRDGQLMSEQETLLYLEVMMMLKYHLDSIIIYECLLKIFNSYWA